MISRQTEDRMRAALLGILALGMVGTGLELLLLKHTEEVWQLLPIILIAIAIVLTALVAVRPGAGLLRGFVALMALFVLSGFIGVVQHFRGNVRDAGESNPSLSGSALYREAVMGTTPALAPGAMLQLGLIGLLFTFRHPVLRGTQDRSDRSIT
jgi:hypothetical protein